MGSFNSHEKRILKWQLFTRIFFGRRRGNIQVSSTCNGNFQRKNRSKQSSKAQTSSEKNTLLV